jgi:hypothetical protein
MRCSGRSDRSVYVAAERKHIRSRIRGAVIAALVAGVPTVEGRVYETLTTTLEQHQFPCIVVEPGARDDVEYAEFDEAPRRQTRVVSVDVVVIAAETADADVSADNIAADVESALGAGLGIGEDDVRLTGISSIYVQGVRQIGVVRTSWDIGVQTLEGAPKSTIYEEA